MGLLLCGLPVRAQLGKAAAMGAQALLLPAFGLPRGRLCLLVRLHGRCQMPGLGVGLLAQAGDVVLQRCRSACRVLSCCW